VASEEPARSGGVPSKWQYTGQEADGTGLVSLHARYYDPAVGQFVSPDTIVPDPSDLFAYQRYLYARANPLKYNDPSGHCPAPPEDLGPVICFALFIAPKTVSPVMGITLKGDGRSFSSDSDPSASRGWVWIDPETGTAIAGPQMHPTTYYDLYTWNRSEPNQLLAAPYGYPSIEDVVRVEPSAQNQWAITRGNDGSIQIAFNLVLAGPLELVAPHINGSVVFTPESDGSFAREGTSWQRDGFPWAEAYYHDGKGNVEALMTDPAARGNPHDLFAYEPGISLLQRPARAWGNYNYGGAIPSVSP
jgi:RHS repeat-associated protein